MSEIGCADAINDLSLLTLPAEILSRICSFLVPLNQTFLLSARKLVEKSPFTERAPLRIIGTSLLPEDAPAPHRPAILFRDHHTNIFTLLLLHSKIHPYIVESLYASNVFYPPDFTTLICLRDSLSNLAISKIRCIRIDACGPSACCVRGYNYFYNWSELANPDIADLPKLFPGLRELRLGGIGPGIVHRREFIYRGSTCVRETEINDVWTLDSLYLIARIVGFRTAHERESGLDKARADEWHPLLNGRVFCMRYEGLESTPPRGSHRQHGSRIIRTGETILRGRNEQEVTDLAVVEAKAIAAVENLKVSGLTEVLI